MATITELYQAATHAFLHQQHAATDAALSSLLQQLSQSPSLPSFWISQLFGTQAEHDVEHFEQSRKAWILYCTYIATVHPHLRKPEYSHASLASQFSALTPEEALSALFHDAVQCFSVQPQPASDKTQLPLADPCLSAVPPSVIIAFALAGIKLQALSFSKALVEAWMASLPVQLEAMLEEAGSAVQHPATSLSESAVLSTGSADKSKDAQTGARESYEKIAAIYSLQVLPRQQEWQEAEDWIKLQAVENGGLLRQSYIEELLISLDDAKMRSSQVLQASIIRAKEVADKKQQTMDAEKKKKLVKPNHRAKLDRAASTNSDTPSSSCNDRPSFASVRNHIADFNAIEHSGKSVAKASPSPAATKIETILALTRTYLLKDPFKILSSILFLFGIFRVMQRLRREALWRGYGARELINAAMMKVVDTIRMATQVTYL